MTVKPSRHAVKGEISVRKKKKKKGSNTKLSNMNYENEKGSGPSRTPRFGASKLRFQVSVQMLRHFPTLPDVSSYPNEQSDADRARLFVAFPRQTDKISDCVRMERDLFHKHKD